MNATATRPVITVPEYWDDACRHLVKSDRVMKRLIPQFGQARLESRGDAFVTYEQDAIGNPSHQSLAGEVVYPRSTILSEQTASAARHSASSMFVQTSMMRVSRVG